MSLKYYRKRGSASYIYIIVREVHSVRERDTERERALSLCNIFIDHLINQFLRCIPLYIYISYHYLFFSLLFIFSGLIYFWSSAPQFNKVFSERERERERERKTDVTSPLSR